MAHRRPYQRAHRYTLSASSQEFLTRGAPHVLALIRAPGSRLTEYARGVRDTPAGHAWPVTVEVGPYARVVLPVALVAGAGALTALSLGDVVPFALCLVLAVGALLAGRGVEEEWLLTLEVSEEPIEAVTPRASLSDAEARRVPDSAGFVVRTTSGRYYWDSATWQQWDAAGRAEILRTVRLAASHAGEPVTGEALRALQVN
jgi:hypothetical protein